MFNRFGKIAACAMFAACCAFLAGGVAGCNEPEYRKVETHEQTYQSEPEMTVDGEAGSTTEMVSPGEMIVE